MLQETVEHVVRNKASDELISVPASSTVAEAVQVMAARHVGAVLIKTEDGLVGGIFTERDVLVRVVNAGLDPKKTPISMVMTRDVRFVTPGTTIEAALSLMHMNRHRHLLVIDGPRVFGLISIGDLVRQMIERGEGRFEAAVRGSRRTPRTLNAVSRRPRHGRHPFSRRRSLVLGVGALALGGLWARSRNRRRTASRYLQFGGSTMGSTYTVPPAGRRQDAMRQLRAVIVRRRSTTSTTHVDVPATDRNCRPSTALRRARRLRYRKTCTTCCRLRATSVAGPDGAFDVTVAPLVEHWGFGTRSVASRARARLQWPRNAVGSTGAALRSTRLVAASTSGMPACRPTSAALPRATVSIARPRRSKRAACRTTWSKSAARCARAASMRRRHAWRIGIEEPDAMPQRARWVVPLTGQARWQPRATTATTSSRTASAIRTRSTRRPGVPIRHSSVLRHGRRRRLHAGRRAGDSADRARARQGQGARRTLRRRRPVHRAAAERCVSRIR